MLLFVCKQTHIHVFVLFQYLFVGSLYFHSFPGAENPGILIINEEHKLVLHDSNKSKTRLWYRCLCSKSKGIECPVKATVSVSIVGEEEADDDKEEGEVRLRLVKLTNKHNHPGFVARIISDTLRVKMAALADQNPDMTAPKIRETIILESMAEYDGDLWEEINMELGDDVCLDKMIKRVQQRKVGPRAQNRDDFNAKAYLTGDNIIVLDSNEELDGNWEEVIENAPQRANTDKCWENETDELHNYEKEADDFDRVDMEDGEGDDDKNTDKPKRVLVFTTPLLLKLFQDNDGKASVDGTWKITPKFWRQTFLLMIEKGGFAITVAFGLLPDKEERSYRIFYYLLLKKLRDLNIKNTLKSFKMDFEINIQRATEVFFPDCEILGCFFHFRF